MEMLHESEEPEKYSSYKSRIFHKTENKLLLLIGGITQTSLKKDDKILLIKRLQKIANDFKQC